MRDGGRLSATLAVLEDFEQRRVPFKVCMADWARGARYAGSKDRAFISGLTLDCLRARGSLLSLGGGLRVAVAKILKEWGWADDRISDAFAEEPHGPGALDASERELLSSSEDALLDDLWKNVPEFVRQDLESVWGDPKEELVALTKRAPIDLRVNLLKSDKDRALRALSGEKLEPVDHAINGVRVSAPSSERRGPSVETLPIYTKGWVEIQDVGSQIAAACCGAVHRKQILDYCAGGGGKALALASMMGNSGQVHAYDNDGRRLAPIFERLRRSGARNVQVHDPRSDTALSGLAGKMDVVLIDAPCSGAGTWRRHPDTKWRLTESQLATRIEEQDDVLKQAAPFVAQGGQLIFVTCSPLPQENDDRIKAFLIAHPDFEHADLSALLAQNEHVDHGKLEPFIEGATLRLSPGTTQTDGFTITALTRISVSS